MFKNKFNALWLLGLLAVPAVVYGLGTLTSNQSQFSYNQVAAGDSGTMNSTLRNSDLLSSNNNNARNMNTGTGMNTLSAGLSGSSSRLSIPGSNNNTNQLNSQLNTGNNRNSNSLGGLTGFGNNLTGNNNRIGSGNNSFAATSNQLNQGTQILNGRNDGFNQGLDGNMGRNNGRNDGLVAIYATPARKPAAPKVEHHDSDHHDVAHHDSVNHDSDHHDSDHHDVAHHDSHSGYEAATDHSFVVQQPLTATTSHSIVTPSGARAVNNLGLDPQVRNSGNHVTTNATYGSVMANSHDEYDAYGYDAEGYDAEGYDWDGYDRAGYDREGYDRPGYDREGYDREGYDREGYDRIGYNRIGFDRNGHYGW